MQQVRLKQVSYGITFMWNLKKLYKWTYLQNRNRFIENKLWFTKRERGWGAGINLKCGINRYTFSSVQSLSRVWLFATPWSTARQASLSITNSWSSLRLTSIESVMPSSHLILCRPLLLPSIPPSIRVFSNESTLHMRWPKYWSFSFSIIPSKEHPFLIDVQIPT